MEILKVSKRLFSPISLPGMGRSVEIDNVSREEAMQIQALFARQDLAVEFIEEPEIHYPVVQLWVNPHGGQVTVFI